MKTFTLSGEITWDSVEKLISELDMITKGKARVYMSSPGGEVAAGEALIHYLDNTKLDIELIGAGSLDSMAFEIFFWSDTRKTLLSDVTGTIQVV